MVNFEVVNLWQILPNLEILTKMELKYQQGIEVGNPTEISTIVWLTNLILIAT